MASSSRGRGRRRRRRGRKTKMAFVLCLFLTMCGPVVSVRSPGPSATPLALASIVQSSATVCDALSLANQIIRGCADGHNISDSCCGSVYSTLGRGINCLCRVKSEPFFRFSPLLGQGEMDKLLTGCYATPYMHDLLSKPCESLSGHVVPSPPILPAVTPSPGPAEIAPPTEDVAAAAQGHVPSRTSGSINEVALILGWVSAGILLAVLAIVLIRSSVTKSCPHCHDIEMTRMMMLRNDEPLDNDSGDSVALHFAMIDNKEDESVPLNPRCAVGVGSSIVAANSTSGVQLVLPITTSTGQDGASIQDDDSLSLNLLSVVGSSTATANTSTGQHGASIIIQDDSVSLHPQYTLGSSSATATTTFTGQDGARSVGDLIPQCAVASSTHTAATFTSQDGVSSNVSTWDPKASSGAGVLDRDKRIIRPNPKFKDYVWK